MLHLAGDGARAALAGAAPDSTGSVDHPRVFALFQRDAWVQSTFANCRRVH